MVYSGVLSRKYVSLITDFLFSLVSVKFYTLSSSISSISLAISSAFVN